MVAITALMAILLVGNLYFLHIYAQAFFGQDLRDKKMSIVGFVLALTSFALVVVAGGDVLAGGLLVSAIGSIFFFGLMSAEILSRQER